MKTTRETSSSPGFTKNSMYVMPRRGSSTRVAFTAFLGWGWGGPESQPTPEGPGGGGGRPGPSGTRELGFQEGLPGLGGDPGSKAGISGAPRGGPRKQDQLPVLNGLRRGGRPKFGHEDADDVEKEDKIDLQWSTWRDGVDVCVCKMPRASGQVRDSAISGLAWSPCCASPTFPSTGTFQAEGSFGSPVGAGCSSALCPSLLPPTQVLTSRTKIMGP